MYIRSHQTEFTFYDSPLPTLPTDRNLLQPYSVIGLSERIDQSRTPFCLRTTLALRIYSDIYLVAFVLSKSDLYVSARVALLEIPRLRMAPTTRHLSAVICTLAHCLIGATSASRYIQYKSPIRLLA